MMDSIFQELLDEFLLEARERVDEVEDLFLGLTSGELDDRQEKLATAKRELHTLKGNSGMMGFADLQQLSHELEDQVEELDLEKPELADLLTVLDTMRGRLASLAIEGSNEESDQEPSADTAADTALEKSATENTGSKNTGSKKNDERSVSGLDSEKEKATPHPKNLEGTAAQEKKPAKKTKASSQGAPSAPLEAGSVRVPFSKIDELVELNAEALIFRNRLGDAVQRGMDLRDDPEQDRALFSTRVEVAWEQIDRSLQQLDKTFNLMQEQVTQLGLVPLQSLFRSLGRIVHDESQREDKQIEFEIVGGKTPIDKTLLEVAREALGHLVRNAVIHGIEKPEKRAARGKNTTGNLRVSASLATGEVCIEVIDDGGGIDFDALLKARQAEAPEVDFDDFDSPEELLFLDGVSTRGGADLGAGRGVGMAAVKSAVERHGGRIEVSTELGSGSRFALHLPVTTSVMRSLLLRVDDEEYALPLTAVAESQRLRKTDLHEMNRALVLRWRNRVVPLLDLGLAFQTSEDLRQDGYSIVIQATGKYRALAVDDIVGIRDIVVKGLDAIVGNPAGIAGSTILGDGRVIMILDPGGLISIPPFLSAAQVTDRKARLSAETSSKEASKADRSER